jgi:hypothetical protein
MYEWQKICKGQKRENNMGSCDKHMKGFEKERFLKELHIHPDVMNRLYKWSDFMAVAKVLVPHCAKGL